MYKVILLDDEKVSLEMLEQNFKWSDYGFEIAGAFSDAKSALKYIKSFSVDVVFTDIEMPEMNGLEFAAEVRKTLPNCKIVILSAYDKFVYAQKAISIGVYEYALKPITDEWAEEILIKLKVQLDKDKGVYSEIDDSYGIKNVRFKSMVEYINEHYMEKISLSNLSEQFNLNATFCCSLFNKKFNCTFTEYYTRLRMRKAAELIKQGEMDLYQIADFLNYDYFYFNKVFKKYYGVTPRRFSNSNE